MIHLKIGLGSVGKMYVFAALTHAHDTQLFKSAENIYQVELAINADLKKVNEWYEFNQMKRNHSKYQAIIFGRAERNPVLTCEGTVIPIQDESWHHYR